MSVSSSVATPTTSTNDQSGPNENHLVPDGKQNPNGKFPPIELPIVPMPSINTYFPKAESELSEKPVDDQLISRNVLSGSNPQRGNFTSTSIGSSGSSANSSNQFTSPPTLTSDSAQLVSTTTNQANHTEFVTNENQIKVNRLNIEKLYEDAEKGNSDAELLLGNLFFVSSGMSKQYERALHWYTKAATHGNIVAQFNLGVMYEKGKGTPIYYKEAAKWYGEAAKQGYLSAQGNLAEMHVHGKGVEQNMH